jgi:hypothetical protein
MQDKKTREAAQKLAETTIWTIGTPVNRGLSGPDFRLAFMGNPGDPACRVLPVFKDARDAQAYLQARTPRSADGVARIPVGCTGAALAEILTYDTQVTHIAVDPPLDRSSVFNIFAAEHFARYITESSGEVG